MAIVTAAADGERSGCLVGFATQCSIEPRRFLVCISVLNRTFEIAQRSNALAVHFPARCSPTSRPETRPPRHSSGPTPGRSSPRDPHITTGLTGATTSTARRWLHPVAWLWCSPSVEGRGLPIAVFDVLRCENIAKAICRHDACASSSSIATRGLPPARSRRAGFLQLDRDACASSSSIATPRARRGRQPQPAAAATVRPGGRVAA
ncbi:MAG: flavin reductase [Solirubrobacteraceae bacterium]